MLFSDGLVRRPGIIVYAFCVDALGSAVVIAAKIPSASYAMGAEGEIIHQPHRHGYTLFCTVYVLETTLKQDVGSGTPRSRETR